MINFLVLYLLDNQSDSLTPIEYKSDESVSNRKRSHRNKFSDSDIKFLQPIVKNTLNLDKTHITDLESSFNYLKDDMHSNEYLTGLLLDF